jgi:Tol biopolymer transport system component/putative cell wall-binding protein
LLSVAALVTALGPTVAAQSGGEVVKEYVSEVGGSAPVSEGMAPEATLPASANGRIAWDSDRGSGTDLEIWAMDSDGGNKTQLTNNTCNDSYPEWSPDGTKIAYQSDCGGDAEVWVMNANGTGQTQLTNNSVYDGEPTWSPDGSRIAFDTTRDTTVSSPPRSTIWWMNADGTSQTRLSSLTLFSGRADWSSNGRSIMYQSYKDGYWSIAYQNVTPQTPSIYYRTIVGGEQYWNFQDAEWAPDDDHVVFARRCPECETVRDNWYAITLADASGSGVTILTSSASKPYPWPDRNPAWSPDGRLIVFESSRYEQSAANPSGTVDDTDIVVISASGGATTNLTTTDSANDSNPDWGPTNKGDQDHDALLDLWEVNGLWGWSCYGPVSDCPAASLTALLEVDLPAMGASPAVRDLFVEVDHMAGFSPNAMAIADVVAAFDARGIHLHVDYASTAPLTAKPGTWGAMSGADSLTHVTTLGSWTGSTYRWLQFDSLKEFDGARTKIFRYAIWADRHATAGNGAPELTRGSSGIARGIPASDFLITLGAFKTVGGTVREQAGTFMHELGHTLGLKHGGVDHIHRKPNYRSVMNYLFQMPWIPDGILDYSGAVLPSLYEGILTEADGIGSPSTQHTRYYCTGVETTDWNSNRVDWNCDGDQTDTFVQADINDDGSNLGYFIGYDDWANLQFAGGGVGGGAGVTPSPPSTSTDPDEITAQEAAQQAEDLGLDGEILRYAGPDRYATAAEISEGDFPTPGAVTTVFVATGLNYPDALAGAAAAGTLRAPLLLVRPDSIPAPVAAELARLDPTTIVVLGGSDVVSDGVKASLGAYATTVIRLQGTNRYATAVEVSKYYYSPGVSHAFIATGLNFPDALAGAALAGRLGAPLLLVPGTSIPSVVAAELARLSPSTIVVLGGPDVVSDGVMTSLGAYAASVIRLQGSNRYRTAVEISEYGFPAGAARVYVATGLNFPDALAGAAAAGGRAAPVLLVPGTSVPIEVSAEIARLGASTIVLLGDTGVVSSGVEATLGTLIGL